jgi:hypothetical protein
MDVVNLDGRASHRKRHLACASPLTARARCVMYFKAIVRLGKVDYPHDR